MGTGKHTREWGWDADFFVGRGWGWGKFDGDEAGDGDNFIYHVTL